MEGVGVRHGVKGTGHIGKLALGLRRRRLNAQSARRSPVVARPSGSSAPSPETGGSGNVRNGSKPASVGTRGIGRLTRAARRCSLLFVPRSPQRRLRPRRRRRVRSLESREVRRDLDRDRLGGRLGRRPARQGRPDPQPRARHARPDGSDAGRGKAPSRRRTLHLLRHRRRDDRRRGQGALQRRRRGRRPQGQNPVQAGAARPGGSRRPGRRPRPRLRPPRHRTGVAARQIHPQSTRRRSPLEAQPPS